MVSTHLGAVALRWSLAGTLLAACHDATTTQTVSAPLPGKEAPMAAQQVAAAPDSAAPPAAAGQSVPFVGRPGVGAVIRAAEANAETH